MANCDRCGKDTWLIVTSAPQPYGFFSLCRRCRNAYMKASAEHAKEFVLEYKKVE